MTTLSGLLFFVAGVANLLPTIGVVSSERLRALYDVPVTDPNLEILLRHRAVLFAVVGGLLVAAALSPPLRPLGLVVGLSSMLSFVVIARLVGGYNGTLRRVEVADLVGSAGLVAAALIDRLA